MDGQQCLGFLKGGDLAVCANKESKFGFDCQQCKDGWLCVPDDATALSGDAPNDFNLLTEADVGYAIMYAKNGFGSSCRYADRSVYDGTPIPRRAADLALCRFGPLRGACYTCPTGFKCTGRSPCIPSASA